MKYIFKLSFWEAWVNIKFCQLTGVPKWRYVWWTSRIELIRNNKI